MAIENDLINLAKKINESTDTVMNDLKAHEKHLRELNLGITAWVPTPIIHSRYDSQTEDFETIDCIQDIYLGWTKRTLGWRLTLREDIHQVTEWDEDGNPLESKIIQSSETPLLEADRSKRLKAFEHLEDLEKQLAIEGNKFLQKVEAIRVRRKEKARAELDQVLGDAGF